jgi:hypothetical protein
MVHSHLVMFSDRDEKTYVVTCTVTGVSRQALFANCEVYLKEWREFTGPVFVGAMQISPDPDLFGPGPPIPFPSRFSGQGEEGEEGQSRSTSTLTRACAAGNPSGSISSCRPKKTPSFSSLLFLRSSCLPSCFRLLFIPAYSFCKPIDLLLICMRLPCHTTKMSLVTLRGHSYPGHRAFKTFPLQMEPLPLPISRSLSVMLSRL